jgi:hypothetical protein
MGKTTITRSLLLAAVSVLLVGCAAMPISRKAEVKAINKVAVVSLSVNEMIYNAKAGPMSDDEYARLKKKSDQIKEHAGQTTDTTQESVKQILKNTSNLYTSELKGIANWDIIPIEETMKLPAYQAFTGEPVAEKYFVPTLVMPDTKYFNPFRDNRYYRENNQKTNQALTELCKQLDVDAVAVLRTKLGYEPAGMQFLGGLGSALASKKTDAIPTVGTAISVITKEGNSAVFFVSKMEYQGPEAAMLQAGLVNFTGDDGVIIKSYEQAIKASAKAIVDRINQELVAE